MENQIRLGPEAFLDRRERIEDRREDFLLRKLGVDLAEPGARFNFSFLFTAFRTIPDPAQIRHLLGMPFGKIRKIRIDEQLIKRNLFHISFEPLKMALNQNPPGHLGTVQEPGQSFFRDHQPSAQMTGDLGNENRWVFGQ